MHVLYVYMYLVIKLQLIIVSLENLTKFTLIYGWSICWGISATADVQVKSKYIYINIYIDL